ncbi:MAG: hypothetical protein L3K26_04855, partial [Candidatus Hydrogenedentes bacterium]|nr:hypothetical protein [Candidatus Hydrogenedentota bacterium]
MTKDNQNHKSWLWPCHLFALCLLAGFGCSPERTPESVYPAPRTMVVLSVEAVADTAPPSLLPNGDFQEWYGGLPFPTGFDAPANATVSTVKRDLMQGHLGTTGYTARQTWQAFEFAEPPEARFGCTLTLKPERDYVLSVVASASSGMVATVDAYTTDESGTALLLAGNVIEVNSEEPKRYTGRFRTDARGTVLLRSQASPLATLPGTVTWSAWALHAASEAADADGKHRRMWAKNSLDHVRQQMALYGGVAAWAKSLYPLQKNLGRIHREAEKKEGSAIQGHGQYIFQKVDLPYVRNVRDFVRTSTEDGLAYQPAFRALLKLDRTLAVRGIELILAPLPDRAHLYVDKIYKPAINLPPSYLPHTRFIAALLEHGAIVVDLAPLLRHRRSEGAPVYWRTDYGVPSYTLGEVAHYVAPLLRDIDLTSAELDVEFTLFKEELPLHQGALPALPSAQQATIGPETRTMLRVREQDNNLFSAAERSPVLV